MNLRRNILELISYGHKYQYYKINIIKEEDNKRLKPKLYFSKYQFFIILSCVGIIVFNDNAFSNDLSGYIISALSLFIGLFFTFIFTLFDKYKSKYTNDFLLTSTDEEKAVNDKNINFYKKVSYLTLYAILIAIITIILFSINLIFNIEAPKLVFFDLIKTVRCFEEYDYHYRLLLVSLYQFLSFYFLFDFLLLTIYILGSIFEYLKGEYK